MNKKRRAVPGVHPYDGPAGGWGALKATAIAVRTQMDALDAPATLLRTNQPDGFDCPGCAWPDKEHKSTFQFCENGAKAVTWEATSKRVTAEFLAANTVSSLLAKSDFELEGYGRLTDPLVYDRASDTLRPVSWERAFARIGEIVSRLQPDEVEFYTSGRASNEAAYLFQLYARELGTNNFPDCSNMCHEATSVGLPQSIGIGKGTVSLDDFDQTELVISIGHNPGTNHPRMMGTLHELSRRGGADNCPQSAKRAGAGAFCRPAERDRNGDLQLNQHRLDLFPGQGRRRRRGAEGHCQGAAADG
ncbi:Formate dehydrogenase H [Raoultella terrigena]|uniref:Formate dehydrogenase H n=1 Tax=Raoultella terrigena TaxID=577 RepID=A0A3P8JVM9_RAOTE|nr:Formate dehydrogenase H [Raoultella terrigena]